MQRKKNIKLLATLVVLIVAAVILSVTSPSKNQMGVDRDKFTYDPASITEVRLTHAGGAEDILSFQNGQWMVNSYKADPQRVSVLFAILSQARVRRKAPASEKNLLDSAFTVKGVTAAFYEGDNVASQFEVVGDELRGLTFYRENAGEEFYMVEIPGYRNYLAGIFELDLNGWRYPRIFDFNWGNLKRVDVSYAQLDSENFGISFFEGFFNVEGLAKSDTSHVTEFLDNLSLLYVNDYLSESESNAYESLKNDLRSQVIVRDVGDNPYQLDVLGVLPGQAEILIRIDSSEYALASFDLMNMVLKPRGYFVQKSGSE